MENAFYIIFILFIMLTFGFIFSYIFDKDWTKDIRILEMENMSLQENLAFEKKYIKALEKKIKHLEEIIKLNEKQKDNRNI